MNEKQSISYASNSLYLKEKTMIQGFIYCCTVYFDNTSSYHQQMHLFISI
jgi:hypothetical protein